MVSPVVQSNPAVRTLTVGAWADFRKLIDGTQQTLKFDYDNTSFAGQVHVITEEWGGWTYEVFLTTGGPDEMDFTANLAPLAEMTHTTVPVSGTVAVSGTVPVSGAVAIVGTVPVSGAVSVSGAVGVSGTVIALADINKTLIHSGATLASAGFVYVTGCLGRDVGLIVNCLSFAGIVLTFTAVQVDPQDTAVNVGNSALLNITGVGAKALTLPALISDTVKISWVATGGYGQVVNTTLVSKAGAGVVGVQSPLGNSFTTALPTSVGSAAEGVVLAIQDEGNIARGPLVSQKSRALLTTDLSMGVFEGLLSNANAGPFLQPRFGEGRKTMASASLADVSDGTYGGAVAATQCQLVSSSGSDTSKVIRCYFLNSTGQLTSEDLTLNGTTPVNTTSSTILAAAHLEQVSGALLVGTISFKTSGGTVLMQIQAGQTRGFYSVLTAPFLAGTSGGRIAVKAVKVSTQGNGGVLFLKTIGTGLNGTSASDPAHDLVSGIRVEAGQKMTTVVFDPPAHVAGGLIVKAEFQPDSATSCTVRVGMDYLALPTSVLN